jgi:2-methylcitrate dehydratase PrpD
MKKNMAGNLCRRGKQTPKAEERMTESTTEHLARFAASVKYEDIPAPAREYCKDILLDTVACAFAGHLGEETDQIARFAKSLATSTESTVIGGNNLSLAGATLLNGYLITAVTMCDIHRSTLTHVTPEVVPPTLLIGERDNVSGRDLLVALAAGFEVTTRVGVGSDYPSVRKRGYHGPGVFGPFGAAAAVGRLRSLSPEAMARAFGLAGSQAGGTFAAWGTPTVKFHQCRGALSGLMAALLAEQNFLATREFLTAKDGGLFNTFSTGGHPEQVTAELGKRWEFEQIALRLWPSASSIQGMNTALFDALDERPFKLKDVRRAHIRLAPTVFNLHGKLSKYKAKFDALISAHYTAAVIIEDHALTLEQFTPARYDDPVLRNAAASLIDLQPDESLSDVQTVVEFELNDGTKIVKRCNSPRGSADNRLTRAQIESKMRTYAQKRIGKAAIERIIASIRAIEDVSSVRDLLQTMRQEVRAAA